MIAGTRKPPSSAVPLPPANGVCPPSGQVKFSAPLSVVNTTMVLSSRPSILEMLHDGADVVVELRHAGFLDRPAVLRDCASLSYLRREMRDDMHARRVVPDEERLAGGLGLVDEGDGLVADDLVDGLHVVFDAVDRMRRQRPFVGDLLLADLAPARIDRRIVGVGRESVQQIARADLVLEVLRIVRVEGVFHRVEVIEIAPELVEAVHASADIRCGRRDGSCRTGRWRSPST